MARLNFVKKARKAIKEAGIAKGDSYYWWKFRFGGKRVSKTRPRRSQLTQSEFLSAIYDAEDSVADAANEFEKDGDFEALASVCESVAEDMRNAGEECMDKYGNMPDSLQQGDTGQLLEQRAESCDATADELENAASEIRSRAEDEPDPDNPDAAKQAAADEVLNVSWPDG